MKSIMKMLSEVLTRNDIARSVGSLLSLLMIWPSLLYACVSSQTISSAAFESNIVFEDAEWFPFHSSV